VFSWQTCIDKDASSLTIQSSSQSDDLFSAEKINRQKSVILGLNALYKSLEGGR